MVLFAKKENMNRQKYLDSTIYQHPPPPIPTPNKKDEEKTVGTDNITWDRHKNMMGLTI